MPLTLTRRAGQTVVIGDALVVEVRQVVPDAVWLVTGGEATRLSHGQLWEPIRGVLISSAWKGDREVKLTVDAPRVMRVLRGELVRADHA